MKRCGQTSWDDEFIYFCGTEKLSSEGQICVWRGSFYAGTSEP